MLILICALATAGAALACFIRWVPLPQWVLWASNGSYGAPMGAMGLMGCYGLPMEASQQLPCPIPCRRRIQQAQLMKGPNKIILTMDDLTFINTLSCKQVP